MYLPIGADKELFYDTDRILSFEIFDGETVGDPVLDSNNHVISYTGIDAGTATMKDMSGKELAFTVRKTAKSSDAIIEKTSSDGITVVGVYDPDREANTQRVEVQIDDVDTYDPDVSPVVNVKAGTYAYALKQTDEGDERILVYGPLVLLQAAAWE